MNKNIIPNLDDVSKLTEQEFINKYKGSKFDSEAEAKVYRKLYKLVHIDDNYKLVYDYRFPPKCQGAPTQIDFLLLKQGIGAALIEVKGIKESPKTDWKIAMHQLNDANYSLNNKINVYNIVIFPDSNLEKETFFQKNRNSATGYIIDKRMFDEWDDSNKCEEYFLQFFNEDRYKHPNPETTETEKELFDGDKYYKRYLEERDRKEEYCINNLTEHLDFISNNPYNCYLIKGYAGTGKTFLAMNIAMKSLKRVLFIVRNQSLFEMVEKYFNNNIECSQRWVIEYDNYKKPTKSIFDLNNNVLTLKRLDMKLFFDLKEELKELIKEHQIFILDEIQDASSYEIKELMNEIKKEKDKVLYLVGDDKQFTNINQKEEFCKVKKIIEQAKNEKLLISIDLSNKNCRNSVEIKNFIYRLIDKKNIYSEKICNIKVFFHNIKSCYNEIIQKEINDINNKEKSVVIYLDNHNSWTVKTLKNLGLKKYEKIKSYNYSKGCEYDEVIVVGCSYKQLLFLDNDLQNDVDRQQLSLAAGRAKEELTLVFYVENDDEKQEIKYILEKDYKFDEDCFLN